LSINRGNKVSKNKLQSLKRKPSPFRLQFLKKFPVQPELYGNCNRITTDL